MTNHKYYVEARDERGEAETEVVIVGPGEAEYRLSRGLDMIGEGRRGGGGGYHQWTETQTNCKL